MTEQEFKQRTKRFGLRVIRLTEDLPRRRAADVIARQLLRSATSVGANYRSACRAKSAADFVAKLAIVEEEADESVYWLEMLGDSGISNSSELPELTREANEILAMTVASIRTARRSVKTKGRGTPINPKSAIQNPKSTRMTPP